MNYRDWLQQVIYKIINPVVRGMIKIGITPNFITTTGLILNIVAAGIFIYAGLVTDSEEDLSLVGWTGGLILFAGLFDMMDGRVARLGNMSSTFGALYDSVLDRYSELFTLFGISSVSYTHLRAHETKAHLAGLFRGFHYHFSCFDRFADGKLRTRTCRRSGTGM